MNLGVSAEQRELRESVRRFLAERAPLTRVRELMETTRGTDPDVWRQASTQLGLPGIAVPEEYGGAGFSFTEDDGSWDPASTRLAATKNAAADNNGWRLDGHKSFVLDAHTADLILVV